MIDVKRLREIRKEFRDLFWRIVDIPIYPIDSNRQTYLFSELDTLFLVISLVETNKFKECFILLRSSLEKYLYFWLMFEGIKYRWTQYYFIERRTSGTDKEARDKTLQLWNSLKNSGDTRYSKCQMQAGHKDNAIIMTCEREGFYVTEEGKRTGEIIPAYNEMLNQYEPAKKHLQDIQNIVNSNLSEGEIDKWYLRQDLLYNQFFYIKNIYRNIKLNRLADDFQINIIRVHYNFLSQYVHPSKYTIELWNELNNHLQYLGNLDKQQILKELILLYAVKLIQLYSSTFVRGYKSTKNQIKYNQCKLIIDELYGMSKDFWFYDNAPTEFDINYSNQLKQSWRWLGKKIPDGLIYNENPLERLSKMRNWSR